MPDINILAFVKISFLILSSMVILLTIVIYNQIRVMDRIITLRGKSGIVKNIGLFLILISISLFIAGIAIL